MTDSEIHLKTIDYILGLEFWIWNDFKKVPADISEKVYNYIEAGTFLEDYHLGWAHMQSDLFMKTKIPKNGTARSSE